MGDGLRVGALALLMLLLQASGVLLAGSVLLASSILLAAGAAAQGKPDVVDRLREQRQAARITEVLADSGRAAPRAAAEEPAYSSEQARFLDAIGQMAERKRQARAERLQAAADSAAAARLLAPPLAEVRFRKVESSEQGAFLERFATAFWTATGSNTRRLGGDAVPTLEHRGRLGFAFGAPTRNAAAQEQEGYAGDPEVLFEYWFVVNDSIPVLVIDPAGPDGDGLLLAGRRKDVAQHPLVHEQIKAALYDVAAAQPRMAPFVDYVYSRATRRWTRAGFDGSALFAEPTRTPRWARRVLSADGEKWRIHR